MDLDFLERFAIETAAVVMGSLIAMLASLG